MMTNANKNNDVVYFHLPLGDFGHSRSHWVKSSNMICVNKKHQKYGMYSNNSIAKISDITVESWFMERAQTNLLKAMKHQKFYSLPFR